MEQQPSREKQNEIEEEKKLYEFNENMKKAARRRSSWQNSTGNGDLDNAVRGYLEAGFIDGATWAKDKVKRAAYLEIAESLKVIPHPVYQRISQTLIDKAENIDE